MSANFRQHDVVKGEFRKTLRWLAVLTLLSGVFCFVNSAAAASDQYVLTELFGPAVLSENVQVIRHQAAQLEESARYEFLSQTVLPSETHRELRITIDFTQVDLVEGESAGGEIVSPVIDLVAVAARLGRLDDLRTRFDNAPQETIDDQLSHLAGLVLVDSAKSDFESANQGLARLYSIIASADHLPAEWEAPALLAGHVAARYEQTRLAARDVAYDMLQSQLGTVRSSQWRTFDRHVFALAAQIDRFSSTEFVEPAGTSSQLTQWHAASIHTAASRGTGAPADVWTRQGTRLRKASGHSIDLLYYQTPLLGNFDVEYDASAYLFRDIEPVYAAKWACPHDGGTACRTGPTSHGWGTTFELTPTMTKSRHELHHRISVRGQTMELAANGRTVIEDQLPVGHNPWVALRRTAKHTGNAWNVRVVGDPEIPDKINLSTSPDLAGWIAYFGETVGGILPNKTRWMQVGNPSHGGTIVGGPRTDIPKGCWRERLLYYSRPMLEDGTIEYGFLFDEEKHATCHPAIDRIAFLLKPDGVQIHEITDGPFDRTDLSPGNFRVEPENRRGPSELPLKNGEFNQVRVSLTGDTIDLFLNDEHIYQRNLEPSNRRNFGIFHYADRSMALVRNIIWRGDWPRELPPLHEQELADDSTRFLDESAAGLVAEFKQSFETDEFPFGSFSIVRGNPVDFQPTSGGLTMRMDGDGHWERSSLATQLGVSGDFDITLSFDEFKTRPGAGGTSSICLKVRLADEADTEFNFRRRDNLATDGKTHQRLVNGDVAAFGPGDVRRATLGSVPMETTQGTLRLARRGDRIYGLFAEGDSSSFRIMSSGETPRDDISLGGIIVQALTNKKSFVQFRLKELKVRAEKLSGPAVEVLDSAEILARINRQREALPVVSEHDFAKEEASEGDFFLWGDVRSWNPDDGGLQFIHEGRENWSATGLAPYARLDGDFDITANFEFQKIVNRDQGIRSTIFLKVHFADERESQAGLLFETTGESLTELYGRVGGPNSRGVNNYRRTGSMPAKDVVSMRLARYGSTMYMLARTDSESEERLVSVTEVPEEPFREHSLNFMVHTRGVGRATHALLKSLSMRAERTVSLPAAVESPLRRRVDSKPPPERKGLFDRVIDFFN